MNNQEQSNDQEQINDGKEQFNDQEQIDEGQEQSNDQEQIDEGQEQSNDQEQINDGQVQFHEKEQINEGKEQFHSESRIELKQGKKSKLKGFLTTVTAGVIGSVLTLTAVTYLPDNQNDNNTTEVAQNLSEGKENPALDVQQVSTSANSVADIVEKASPAIVGIVNMQQQTNPFGQQSTEGVEAGSGSGVIFKKTDDGAYIVTNNHVIEGAQEIEVSLYDGEKVKAELVGTDSLTDIAVLKITGDISAEAITFGDSSTLRAGDQVLAIGNPLGLDLSRTVTQGIVSAVDRSIEIPTSAGKWELAVIQTDAAINPGNSGGALINLAGELIGINSLKIANSGVEGLGFAIPSNDVQTIIDELIENGQVVRPYLGVGLAGLEEIPQFYLQKLPNSITQGAIITNIDQSSAAAKAGLQVEDIIVSIGGKEVTKADDLRKYLYTDFAIGDEVKIEFYRQGELQSVNVTLTSNQQAD